MILQRIIYIPNTYSNTKDMSNESALVLVCFYSLIANLILLISLYKIVKIIFDKRRDKDLSIIDDIRKRVNDSFFTEITFSFPINIFYWILYIISTLPVLIHLIK